MPEAQVTSIIELRSDVRHPARKPFQSYKIIFDGTSGAGLKSEAIEKIGLGLSDFCFDTPFTVATLMTFVVMLLVIVWLPACY